LSLDTRILQIEVVGRVRRNQAARQRGLADLAGTDKYHGAIAFECVGDGMPEARPIDVHAVIVY
jgi:hypothetical protein